MTDGKIIAIVGATGAQGGGLARAILADPAGGFAVRALTRNPDSAAARALAAQGAEVVQVDLDDAASVRRAFQGAWGAFCVTNFWEHFSAEREEAQAAHMAGAAADAGLAHVVWSTLEDVRRFVPLSDPAIPTLQGRYKVPHFDGKGASDRHFTERGVPTTFVLASYYWDNLVHLGAGPQRGKDGNLVFALPMADRRLAGIAAEDIGKCAYGVLRRGPALAGRRIGLAGEHLTGEEMAAALGRALGEPVAYRPLSYDEFQALGFPGADDLANMFRFFCAFEEPFLGARPVHTARELNPELQSFEAWLGTNASRIPIAPRR
ncbi:MAG TPA: NmrA/HSCARG family protein [Woeseiaceae bacterium]|nr:NmrA/HSCARG family protein [Woeseiaceae bacterium]